MDTVLPLRRRTMNDLPMPTWFPEDENEALAEELFDDELFQFTQPTITYEETQQKSKA